VIQAELLRIVASVSSEFDVPGGNKLGSNSNSLDTIFSIVFGIAGAVALVVLMLASLKYVLSRGDPGETAKAKNAIIYAVVGLVVVASAFIIVSFVVDKV
jgi:hypothetical protein